MATHHPPRVPLGGGASAGNAAVQRPWRTAPRLSSVGALAEGFLERAGFDRGPWLVVAFAGGIAAWFALAEPWQWLAALFAGILIALSALTLPGISSDYARLRNACVALGLAFAVGVFVIWVRSETVGAEAIERPSVMPVQGYVLTREDQPARGRIRLELAIRDAETGSARRIRVNVPLEKARNSMAEGAILKFRARLMPVWWLVGRSLDALLWIAHTTAEQPGAVKLLPQMSGLTFALFVVGGLWLALWKGRARLFGFVPATVATVLLITTPVPDILISSDGRHVGIVSQGGELVSLRESRSDYALDNLLELAGAQGEPVAMEDFANSRCSGEFCSVTVEAGGRDWQLLMARGNLRVEERALAAACERADIVIADRWLPASCRPRWLKADEKLLDQTGGLALVLADRRIDSVADHQGEHGWWRGAR